MGNVGPDECVDVQSDLEQLFAFDRRALFSCCETMVYYHHNCSSCSRSNSRSNSVEAETVVKVVELKQ